MDRAITSSWRWAELIVAELMAQRVDYFCIAPGSRSSPLTLAVAKHPKTRSFVHFDERSLAFHAFGYAKGSGKPAAIIVTSGSAVANLFPALMAADAERVPLIVLTADRPPELLHSGANQTTDQCKIFGSFVRSFVELPCPSEPLSEAYLRRTLAHALYMAQRSPQGPVHINCLLREQEKDHRSGSLDTYPFTHYAQSIATPSDETLCLLAEKISPLQRGAVVIGSLTAQENIEPILSLAEKLKWPVFSDILSRRGAAHFPLLPCSEWQFATAPPVEGVLHFGDRLVSKWLLEWLENSHPSFYGMVANHPVRIDPTHRVTHRLECAPELFCQKILPLLSPHLSSPWLAQWQERSELICEELANICSTLPLCEPLLSHTLSRADTSEWALFFANSMPIRDADTFFLPKNRCGAIFASRGVSGIDGNIATAIGIAEGAERPLLALIGDMAALHDLNALAGVQQTSHPLVLVIINNGGGGIFSFLPASEKEEHSERYWAAAHAWRFAAAAEMFGIPYYAPKRRNEWEALLDNALKKRLSCLIEITTDRQENLLLHKTISKQIKELCLQPAGSK